MKHLICKGSSGGTACGNYTTGDDRVENFNDVDCPACESREARRRQRAYSILMLDPVLQSDAEKMFNEEYKCTYKSVIDLDKRQWTIWKEGQDGSPR